MANIELDGPNRTIKVDASDLTLDIPAEIILDSGDGAIRFKDDGVHIASLANSSSDFIISTAVSDKDLKFNGNDGGAAITALTLDMSAAGAAAFNAGATFASNVTISTADNTTQLQLISTDADADSGPHLSLFRNSGSVADNDLLGMIQFDGVDDGGNTTTYARFISQIIDAGDGSGGSEDTAFRLQTRVSGTLRSLFSIEGGTSGQGEIVVNDPQIDMDFRVEGNGIDDVLHVNAGTDSLCVGRQAAETAERLSVEQSGNDWCQVNVHSLSSGNMYMFNNKFTAQAPDNNTSYFMNFQDFDGSGATIRFRIFSDGDVQNHDNSYGSTSDERIKQGIRDANSQWDDIKALKIRNFKKNDDVAQYGDKAWEQIGVIAQELEASGMDKLVKKETVWDKDDPEVKGGEATEGDIKEYKAVKYSVLYMKAIKALQEAMAKIETLETKVKALEDA